MRWSRDAWRERLARQNVRYAEVIFSVGVVLWKKQEVAPIFRAIRSGGRARRGGALDRGCDPPLRTGACDAGSGGRPRRWRAKAWWRSGSAATRPGSGRLVRRNYRFARAKGLRLTAHAGEAAGPESVWKALEIGAERIGHGIRAIEDPVLVRHLADRAIPLEICITSNVMTGVVKGLREHPVRRLYDAGVPITLNTDDPGIFRTSLCAEYELAAREFGFGQNELEEIAANGFRFAFKEKHRVD